jgi:hypothetical protein
MNLLAGAPDTTYPAQLQRTYVSLIIISRPESPPYIPARAHSDLPVKYKCYILQPVEPVIPRETISHSLSPAPLTHPRSIRHSTGTIETPIRGMHGEWEREMKLVQVTYYIFFVGRQADQAC